MDISRRSAVALLISGSLLAACSSNSNSSGKFKNKVDFSAGPQDKQPLRVLAGSEQKILEPLFEKYAKSKDTNIQIKYMGSLDIMYELQQGAPNYDVLMPASSMWLTIGDDKKVLKYTQSTAISPVVFGVKRSKAKQLGFPNGGEISLNSIIDAIKKKQLSFAMTSASQSNSGASAYLGFLSAIAKDPNGLSKADLERPLVQKEITTLLSGVNRSSGSSNWLVDLFLKSNYDAMVNYETLIIQANQQLVKQGKEPLVLLYPKDGLTLSDAPMAYVSHGNDKTAANKEKQFKDLQSFILSSESQNFIERTGKRNAFGRVSSTNKDVFTKWGVDLNRTLTPIKLPPADVIMQAITMYQTQFKKPALTVYVLDYSGSMQGSRFSHMTSALSEILIPQNAQKNLLQGTPKDITVAFPFSTDVDPEIVAHGNGQELHALYDQLVNKQPDGDTALYEAVNAALQYLDKMGSKLHDYTPAIVVLTDGEANGSMTIDDLKQSYNEVKQDDIPIFSILFGDSDSSELEAMANLSGGKVFDGKGNLTSAFKEVKGYN